TTSCSPTWWRPTSRRTRRWSASAGGSWRPSGTPGIEPSPIPIEPMAPHEWADYLEAASEHLRLTRLAVEAGCPGPPGAARPTEPLPDELRDRVQLLAMGYDQLALEVSTRMTQIQRCRRGPA